ncbi:MAG: hypothetical protein SNJ82_10665 [Gemmataceae bacterium]
MPGSVKNQRFRLQAVQRAVPSEEESSTALFSEEGLTQFRARLVPLVITGWKANESDRLLGRGIRAYYDREYVEAWKMLDAVNRLAPRDARVRYSLALAERALGDQSVAKTSGPHGRVAKGKAMSRELAFTLNRVQREPRN